MLCTYVTYFSKSAFDLSIVFLLTEADILTVVFIGSIWEI